MKNNIIMLVGLPGQGKSTFVEQNQMAITVKYGVDALLSSDRIIADSASDLGKTYSEVFLDVIDMANKYVDVMVGLLSYSSRNFIIDRTNLTKHARGVMLSRIKKPENYNKIAVLFDTVNPIELRKRLDERAETEGKVINAQLISEMQARYEAPSLSEGFDEVMTMEEFYNTLPDLSAQVYGETKFA